MHTLWNIFIKMRKIYKAHWINLLKYYSVNNKNNKNLSLFEN